MVIISKNFDVYRKKYLVLQGKSGVIEKNHSAFH